MVGGFREVAMEIALEEFAFKLWLSMKCPRQKLSCFLLLNIDRFC